MRRFTSRGRDKKGILPAGLAHRGFSDGGAPRPPLVKGRRSGFPEDIKKRLFTPLPS